MGWIVTKLASDPILSCHRVSSSVPLEMGTIVHLMLEGL